MDNINNTLDKIESELLYIHNTENITKYQSFDNTQSIELPPYNLNEKTLKDVLDSIRDDNAPDVRSILENELINKVVWNALNGITFMKDYNHYDHNIEVLKDMSGFVDPNTGYIEHQEDEAWENVLIGYSNIYNSGCGAIATYNALVGLGDTTDMEDIIKWYEDDTGLNVFGYFGVNPYKIDNYFEDHGYTTNQYNNVTKLPTEAQSDVVIVCHWNDEDDITSGAHFVALTKIIGENGKTYYAEHNNKSKSNKYSSLYEYYEQNKEYGFVSATEIYK